jgi:hypothetical protein
MNNRIFDNLKFDIPTVVTVIGWVIILIFFAGGFYKGNSMSQNEICQLKSDLESNKKEHSEFNKCLATQQQAYVDIMRELDHIEKKLDERGRR